jgi:hypothetical protein
MCCIYRDRLESKTFGRDYIVNADHAIVTELEYSRETHHVMD